MIKMNSWLVSQQEMLSQQILSNVLPHAILITGAKGAGKNQLAQWLKELLICQYPVASNKIFTACQQCKTCMLYKSNTYPDTLTVTAEKTTIGVDTIRLVSHFFEKTAQIGKVKTAFISQAELMTTAAANALLKTLEEPTKNSFIILETTKTDSLLPTIISRCRLIDIRPPIGEQLINEFNAEHGNAFTNITHIAELSDESVAQAFKLVEQHFLAYINDGTDRLELLKVLSEQPEAYRWLEKIICNQIRSYNAWLSFENNDLAGDQIQTKMSQKSLLAIYQQLMTSKNVISNLPQANSRFILEKLLIDIDIMRASNNTKGD